MSQKDVKPVTIPEIALDILLKLIPDLDTAQPAQVYRFIRSCDSAFEMASTDQKPVLLTFTLNKIIGPGASDVHSKQFSLWKDLKGYIIQKFSQTKTLAHLHLELQSMFQKQSESITDYYLRVDLCRSKILEKLATETKDQTLEGRKATTEETALNVFINGINTDIGMMLRVQSFRYLSDAGTFAIQEEKIRNMNSARQRLYKNTMVSPTTQTRKPFPIINQAQGPNSSASQTQRHPKFCNYCKNPGHEISECRKRAYNNRLRNTNNTTNQNQRPTFVQPRVTHPSPARMNNLNSQATEDLSISSEIALRHCSAAPTMSNSNIPHLETDLDNLQLQ